LTFRMSKKYNFDFLFFEKQVSKTSDFYVIFSKIKGASPLLPLFLLGKRVVVIQKMDYLF
ncbi:hypothetical protein B1A98_19915, partial [Bacillus badius]